MQKVMIAIAGIAGLFGLIALSGGLSYFGLSVQSIVGKKAEEVRHDIFKESTAYIDGKKAILDKLIVEHTTATGAARAAIEATVRNQFATMDTSEFPQYQRDFLKGVGVY